MALRKYGTGLSSADGRPEQLNETQLKLVARFMEFLVETQEHQGGEFQIGRERGEINRC